MINLLASAKNALLELNSVLSIRQKKRTIIVMIVSLLCALFELLGVTAILPFLQALLTPDELLGNKIIAFFCRIFSISSSQEIIILVSICLISVYLFKNLFVMFGYYVQYSFAASVERELSIAMLRAYMAHPYVFFLSVNSGEMLRGCRDDSYAIYVILSDLFTIITELISFLVIGVFLFVSEPFVAFSMLVLVSVVAVCIVVFFRPYVKRIGKKNLSILATYNKTIYQTLTGVKEIFVTQRKSYFVKEYNEAAKAKAKVDKKHGCLNAIPDRIIEGICVSGLIGIIVVHLMMGANSRQFVPKLGMFAMAAFKLLPSVGKITNRLTSITYRIPALDNVSRIITEAKEYEEKQSSESLSDNDDGSPLVFESFIHVKSIKWQYEGAKDAVIDGLSITIRKGESIAFIGESGSGKTTLADIILGLLRPHVGQVLLDGVDIFSVPKRWANTIGYVPQSVFLIDDTIRNNVAFGIENYCVEDIWEALEKSQLKSMVEELPDGIETIVGERGVRLSGGQRQRIAIARALFSKPQILVLDEATSALDNDTESAVMEAIDALQGQITMIIIAHRLTTIRNCDRIFEIIDGVARERTHDEVFEH